MRYIRSILTVAGIIFLLGSNLSTISYVTSNNIHSRIIDITFNYNNFDLYYDNSLTFTANVEILNNEQNSSQLVYSSNCNQVLNIQIISINNSIELVPDITCVNTGHVVEYQSGITQLTTSAEIHFTNYNQSIAPDSSYRITYPVNGGLEFGVDLDIINGTSVVSFDTVGGNWVEGDFNTKTTGVNTLQESETLLITYTRAFSVLFTFISLIMIRKIKK